MDNYTKQLQQPLQQPPQPQYGVRDNPIQQIATSLVSAPSPALFGGPMPGLAKPETPYTPGPPFDMSPGGGSLPDMPSPPAPAMPAPQMPAPSPAPHPSGFAGQGISTAPAGVPVTTPYGTFTPGLPAGGTGYRYSHGSASGLFGLGRASSGGWGAGYGG